MSDELTLDEWPKKLLAHYDKIKRPFTVELDNAKIRVDEKSTVSSIKDDYLRNAKLDWSV